MQSKLEFGSIDDQEKVRDDISSTSNVQLGTKKKKGAARKPKEPKPMKEPKPKKPKKVKQKTFVETVLTSEQEAQKVLKDLAELSDED